MSKQANANAAQGYRTEPRNCGNCACREFELELPAWMKRQPQQEWDDRYKQERNQRCGLGGFAIKKTATCDQWRQREAI